uniref:Uncharacterized protein n=1 Tax=Timema douglasi TaxID=61478 RepID=A0A7R8VMT7_TIMDO|nr:unnamed protein product [Timema douglasi]
MQDTNLEG